MQQQEIINLYKQRLAFYGPLHQKMKLIQSIYNGTMQVPLPDMEQNAMPSVPNLLAAGVDQMAGRITSVIPSVNFASVKPGVRSSDRRAVTAAAAVTGWWQQDRLPMKMKQRGRQLIAYGMAPVVIRWDATNGRPTWQTRHPLETFPSTDLLPGQLSPTDCIFAYRRSVGWLRSAGYGDKLRTLFNDRSEPMPNDASVLMLEYIDTEETHLIAAGYKAADPLNQYEMEFSGNQMKGTTLENFANMSGDVSPVVIPMRITLDTAGGQFDNMIGMYYQQAKLMSLETIAVEKGIFPDTYLVSRAGEVGRFLDGPHDGRTGMVNIIAGGDIKEVQSSPGYLTNPTIDRLERNQRVTAGIPQEFGGESGSNIRTGRRGDAVLSAVIDFPVAEAQETFGYSLAEEDRAGIELSKMWAPDTKKTMYVGTGNSARPVTYVPEETFVTNEHVVSYPASGSDVNSLIQGIGQRVGLGIMSKATASDLDPFIDNPEIEHDEIIAEGLEAALMASLQTKAAAGEIPPLVLSKIMKLVRSDKMELAEAMTKVNEEAMEEAQKEQEAEAPMTPDRAMAGATVGAMSGPAAGAMAEEQAAIQPPNQDQMNLGSLLSTLRRGNPGA